MTESAGNAHTTVSTPELKSQLERLFTAYYGEPTTIIDLNRQPSKYRSSFALEALSLRLSSERQLEIMFKDLSWSGLTADACRAKRHASYDPLRELAVYDEVLRRHPTLGASCFGTVADSAQDRYWLFIEQFRGVELYQIGDFDVWKHVARWLAVMHASLRRTVEGNAALQARLITHEAAQQELWFRRACQSVASTHGAVASRGLKELFKLLPRLNRALSTGRPTLIHGEFYPSNIMVANTDTSWRVCAVDWEMAGLGVGLLDLAALVAGRWTAAQQQELACSYYQVISTHGEEWREVDFFETLDCCRLYIALRWLGWSDEWTAPSDHAHDWLEGAMSAGQRLMESAIRYK